MRIGPYKRLGPDLHTTWGTYPSPYITQPASAVMRPWLPPTIRGRHQYRVQPRPLTALPQDPVHHNGVTRDIANRARASLVPGNPGYGAVQAEVASPTTIAAATADPQKETKISTYLFVGALGLLAVGWLALGGKSAPKQNPRRGRRRRPARQPGPCPGAAGRETLWRKLSASQKAAALEAYGTKSRVPKSAMLDILGAW